MAGQIINTLQGIRDKTATVTILLGAALIALAFVTVGQQPYYAVANAATGGFVIMAGLTNRKDTIRRQNRTENDCTT